MNTDRLAEAWGGVTALARDLAQGARVGDYVEEWDDNEPMGDMLRDALRAQLRARDLALESDDRGLRIVVRKP